MKIIKTSSLLKLAGWKEQTEELDDFLDRGGTIQPVKKIFVEGKPEAEKDYKDEKLNSWCRRRGLKKDETNCTSKPCNSNECVFEALSEGGEPGNISCVAIDNNPEKFQYLRKSRKYLDFCPQKPELRTPKQKDWKRTLEEDYTNFEKSVNQTKRPGLSTNY